MATRARRRNPNFKPASNAAASRPRPAPVVTSSYQPPALVQTYGEPAAEKVLTSFDQYVDLAYGGNAVVFGLLNVDLRLFSEARLCWRDRKDLKLTYEPGGLEKLERPWPNCFTGEMLARMKQDAAIAGNAYIRDCGSRLERLRPDWVTIVSWVTTDDLGHEVREVIGYMFDPSGDPERSPDWYPVEEVAHWAPIPDPRANWRGMSWFTPALREINADRAMTEHRERFFRSAATPNLIIKYSGKIQPAQKIGLAESIAAKHGGPDKAGGTLVLDEGADPMIVGAKFSDAQFQEVLAATENRMAVAAGVPALLAGLKEGLDAAAWSMYRQAMRAYADMKVRPEWRSACSALSVLVDVPEGHELWYDTRDIAALQESETESAQRMQIVASTLSTLVTTGFTKDSAVLAVSSGDETKLVDSGLVSVQLLPPGQQEQPADAKPDPGKPASEGDAKPQDTSRALVEALVDVVQRSAATTDRLIGVIERNWGPEQERLHPRDGEGQFASVPGMPDRLVSITVKVLGGAVTASSKHDGGGKATLSANGRSVDLDDHDLNELRRTIISAQYGDDSKAGSDGVYRVVDNGNTITGEKSKILVSLRPVEGRFISETGKKFSNPDDGPDDEEYYNAEFDMVVAEGSDGEFGDYPSTRVSLKDLETDDNLKGFYSALQRAAVARRIDTGNGPTDVFSPRTGVVGFRMKDDNGNATEVTFNAGETRRLKSAIDDVMYGEGEGVEDLSIPRDDRVTFETSGGPVEARFKGHRTDRQWVGTLTLFPDGAPWSVAVDGPHIDEFIEALISSGSQAGILERARALSVDHGLERAWTAEQAKLHPRGPGGKFIRKVGEALLSGRPDALDRFSREQLRREARARGLDIPHGAHIDVIKDALWDHEGAAKVDLPNTAAGMRQRADKLLSDMPTDKAGRDRVHTEVGSLTIEADRLDAAERDGAKNDIFDALAKMRAKPVSGDREKVEQVLTPMSHKELDEVSVRFGISDVKGSKQQKRDRLVQALVGFRLDENAILNASNGTGQPPPTREEAEKAFARIRQTRDAAEKAAQDAGFTEPHRVPIFGDGQKLEAAGPSDALETLRHAKSTDRQKITDLLHGMTDGELFDAASALTTVRKPKKGTNRDKLIDDILEGTVGFRERSKAIGGFEGEGNPIELRGSTPQASKVRTPKPPRKALARQPRRQSTEERIANLNAISGGDIWAQLRQHDSTRSLTDEDVEYIARSMGEHGREYWTRNPQGLAKWVDHEHPLTALHRHIMGFDGMTPDRAWRIAAQWFHDVHGYWPAEREGANPIGPEPGTHRSRSGELEDEPHEEAGADG